MGFKVFPEFVYLVTIDGEWPISAFMGDGHEISRIEAELRRRTTDSNPPRSTVRAHVWKARLDDIHEVDFIPARTIEAYIRDRNE